MSALILRLAATVLVVLPLAACSGFSIPGFTGGPTATAALAPEPAERTETATATDVSPLSAYAPATTNVGPDPHLNDRIDYWAQHYGLPASLVHRVVRRESTYNPRARNGPYYGLMQILPATARTMGYRGEPAGLLDADTNMRYAVRYLRGAYIVAGGDHDRAVRLYASGYYYHARDMGLLEETGLRPAR